MTPNFVVNVLVDAVFQELLNQVGEDKQELLFLYSWLVMLLHNPDSVPEEDQRDFIFRAYRVLRQ